MSLNKKLLHSTILAGVSTMAIGAFAAQAQAQLTFTGSGTAGVYSNGGGNHGGAATTGSGPGSITVNGGLTLTNDGTVGPGTDDALIYLNDANSANNGLNIGAGSTLRLTGGVNSTVNVEWSAANITLGAGARIEKTGAGLGNAIYSGQNLTITNGGTITASDGRGTVWVENGNLTITGTGSITNTSGNDGDDDAIRVVGGGTVNLTFTGTSSNVSAGLGGSAIDLAGATATDQFVTFADGAGSSSGGIKLGGSAGDATLRFTGANNSTIAGSVEAVVGANTTLTVAKTAAADTATITGVITNVDAVNVNSGTLDLDAAGSSFTNVSVASGAILDIAGITGAFTVTNNFTVTGTLTTQTAAVIAGNMSLASGSAVNGDLVFDGNDSTLTFSGNATNEYTANMNGGGGADIINVARDAANTVTLSGTISGFETVNVTTGNLTLSGAVSDVTHFNVVGGQTLTFGTHASDVSFTQVDLQNNNSAVVFNRAGQTFTGNVVDTTAGADTQLVTLTNGTLLGNVTLSGGDDTLTVSNGVLGTLGVHTVNMGGGNDTIQLDGGSIASAVDTGGGNDIFNFAGGTFTGGIHMGADGTDTFNVTATGLSTGSAVTGVDVFSVGAGHTFAANHSINTNGARGAGNLELGAGSTFHAAGANAYFGNNINFGNASTLHINTGRTVSATGVSGANGTVTIGFNNTDSGKLILNSVANMSPYTLHPLVDPGLTITGSKAYVIVDGANGNATKFGTIVDSNTLFTYTQSEDDVNGDIILHVARQNQMSEITKTPNTKSAAPSVEQMLTINTNTPQANRDPVTTAFAARLTTSNDAQIEQIMQTVIPTVDQGGVVAAINVKHQAYSQVNARLADARQGTATGMSAGDAGNDVRYWMQGFGSKSEQDVRQGIAGYDADTYGLSVGADADVSDNAVLGLAFSYADTDVDSDNANRTKTEIDSYQLTAYGSYNWNQGTYMNGYMSYSYNDIDQARHNVGIIGNTAKADYHNDQYDARVELGHDFKNVLNTGGLTLTPEVSAQYTVVDVERYSEKGAGGLGLQNVDSETLQALDLGVNVTVAYNHRMENGGVLTPSVKAGYSYEALGENLETSGSFIGGGAAFVTKGYDPAQHSVTGGLGLKYSTGDSWDFSADYDYTSKSDYDSHSGIIKAIYSF